MAQKRREYCWLLTRKHHLHQISLLNVTGPFNQLQDVVGGCVMLEQQNLVINAIEAALRELEHTEKHNRNVMLGRSTV